MSQPMRVGVLVLACLASGSVTATAQTPPASAAAQPAGPLKVLLICDVCDLTYLRSSLGFVQFTSDAVQADVDVVVRTGVVGADARWSIAVTGRGRFVGQNRRFSYRLPQTMPEGLLQVELARFLKLGLAEYAAATPSGQYLDLGFRRPPPASGTNPIQKDQNDPWNYWVFRTGASTYVSGEKLSSYGSYSLSGSANRTTDSWKIRFGASRSVNTNSFTIDENTTIKTRLTDWSVDSLVVKSLGPRWSFGLTSSVVGSTYSNSKLVSRFTPGVEYDIFPYSESAKRSLTIQYTVGGAHYDYEHVTVFDRLSESIATHAVGVSLGLRQPWGQAGGSFNFSQHLTALERSRTSLNGSISVRLIKSLTLNTSGSYSRIRDQFTLEKGEATDDEILLRLRQLATGYRYSFSVGFGYSFGALSNATVNPRFGG